MILKKLQRLFGHGGAAASAAAGPAQALAPLPAALGDYLAAIADGRFSDINARQLCLLDREGIVRETAGMRSHPIVARLGGWILDDPYTSNFHVYLTAPALAGSVLYLSHDGDTQVVFASLAAFLEAAQMCVESASSLPEFHPVCAPMAADQAALSRTIAGLSHSDDDDEAVLLAVIPSLDAVGSVWLETLARSDNFFVAEAAGTLIERRPSTALWTMAQLCATHPHPQAADAGKRALAAIGKPDLVTSYSEKNHAAFEVAYRFLRPEEDGRLSAPWQHTRWDFLYEKDDPHEDGIWMIWPEFIGTDRAPYPRGLVPASGRALMFIASAELVPFHRGRIALGTKGFFVEGARHVAECEVVALHGLAG